MALGTITPRLIYLEDCAVTTNPSGESENVNVLGASNNPQTLNKMPLVLLTQFTQAYSDSDAAGKGVPVGAIYYNLATAKLHARLS